MSTLQVPEFHQFAHDDRLGRAMMNGTPPYRINNAVKNHIHGAVRVETRAAPNPSTFYKTYLEPNVRLLGDQEYFEPDDDGYTCRSGDAAGHNVSVDDAQPQSEGHAPAYKLAVRLANRSNGAPLATIIEQGSCSTLNSHGALLSVGRFPSLKATENTSPIRGSRRRSRSLDDKALQDIQEDLARESDTFAVAVPHARREEEHGAADPANSTATPLISYPFETQQSPSCHSGDELFDPDDRGVKGFIRGVLQIVRDVSRTRSRLSPITHAPIVEHRDSPLSTYESSTQFDQAVKGTEVVHLPIYNCSTSNCPSEGSTIPPAQTRNRAAASSGTDLSARVPLPRLQSRLDATELDSDRDPLRPVLPYRVATRSHERPFSTPLVHAGTRDVAQKYGTAQASPPHHDMFDTSARYPLDGVPMCRRCLFSDEDTNDARDVFTSQNASFCSTMSTSYSGTVLGVDLDLQHDFHHPFRRSKSPPTPVWFTPQMAELEMQASLLESPESAKTSVPDPALCQSITSSALASLLPIAAATGVVQPNYHTPTISFYSPSGNLIQPESSLPQCTSPSGHSSSPTIATSYYHRQNTNALSSAGSRPTRPLSIPMTTSPTQKAPLPLHLRHHHNRHHAEMSQISSRESFIDPKGPVKGCDGVVRKNSLTPRSGAFSPFEKDKVHRSAKLLVNDLRDEAKIYKARFLAMAAAQSFTPSMSKGRSLQQRHLHDYNVYARKHYTGNTETREGRFRVEALGPLLAHAFRVCCCQPYEGAGTSTHATAARACMAGEPFPANGRLGADQNVKDAERSLPNARVVGKRRHSECWDTKSAARRDNAFSSTTERASYIGTAKAKVH